MKLIVGLGNPGKEYELTRHNMGFITIDKLCDKLNIELNKNKFNGNYYQGLINNEKVIILKPHTYMNLSGECVVQFVNYFNINMEDILIIFDDMDINVGKIRIRKKGSSGHQKGMQNIIDHLKTQDIARIRVGIGKNTMNDVKDYVLSKIKQEELELINESTNNASNACIDFIKHDLDYILNNYNKKD
ncbi:MAG: aminoacyl-tRNA hydrolase [Bacilli bacterium]|jgi:PTH1 family peptidyl-tRNA hydrolase|nr:aminoacyl-tRNA hydrolase [Bacilli bacterium]